MEQMNEKISHTSLMIETVYSLNDVKFDDIMNYDNAEKIWDMLKLVHGGDDNVIRPKVEILRGKYDDIRMKEGENVGQYVN